MRYFVLKNFFTEICGFLKNLFKLKNIWVPNEYFGTITDGRLKLNVVFKTDETSEIDFEIGS